MDSAATRAFLDNIDDSPNSFERAIAAWAPYEATLRPTTLGTRRTILPGEYYDGLVKIFDAPMSLRTMRAVTRNEDLLMAAPSRRVMIPGLPAIASSLDRFRDNLEAYSNGILNLLPNYNNIAICGGAIDACLCPDHVLGDPVGRSDYFFDSYIIADVDIFCYGLDDDEIRLKAFEIQLALEAACESTVQMTETKKAFSFIGNSGVNWRKVQLIKRRFGSPAEILASFDLDAPSALFTGHDVWMSPRAIVAMCTMTNKIDFPRGTTPSYEGRLAKYAVRGYRVYFPGVDRSESAGLSEAIRLKKTGISLLCAFDNSMRGVSRSRAIELVQEYRGTLGTEDYASDHDLADNDSEDVSN